MINLGRPPFAQEDKIITLSTCDYDVSDGRLLVCAKLNWVVQIIKIRNNNKVYKDKLYYIEKKTIEKKVKSNEKILSSFLFK